VLRQYLPAAYAAVQRGEIDTRAQSLVVYHVRQVLGEYSHACHPEAAGTTTEKGSTP
jgi:tagatose-1,6-bisphosphate aldolase non-catalytic subunit AgaZ/GatZ